MARKFLQKKLKTQKVFHYCIVCDSHFGCCEYNIKQSWCCECENSKDCCYRDLKHGSFEKSHGICLKCLKLINLNRHLKKMHR